MVDHRRITLVSKQHGLSQTQIIILFVILACGRGYAAGIHDYAKKVFDFDLSAKGMAYALEALKRRDLIKITAYGKIKSASGRFRCYYSLTEKGHAFCAKFRVMTKFTADQKTKNEPAA